MRACFVFSVAQLKLLLRVAFALKIGDLNCGCSWRGVKELE